MEIIQNVTYNDFVNTVKSENKRIICYGAGLVGLSIEDIFRNSGIIDNICRFVDRDPKKHGLHMRFAQKSIGISGIDYLFEINLSDKILLITCDVFGAVINTLNEYRELATLPCYIFPELNQTYIKDIVANDSYCKRNSQTEYIAPQIPKVIHYCWFGGADVPEFMKKCISTWKLHNPDYEIVCWQESNYDVYANNYIKQAYESGKFAFVSDFARMDILYRYGGIYLDTDVEVLKNFDILLGNKAFIAYDEWAVPNSAVSGSVPRHEVIRQIRDTRSKIDFINADGSHNLTVNGLFELSVLRKYGYRKDFSYQNIGGITVYPPCFFAQSGRLGLNAEVDGRTYTIHHALGSWANHNRTAELRLTNAFAEKLK